MAKPESSFAEVPDTGFALLNLLVDSARRRLLMVPWAGIEPARLAAAGDFELAIDSVCVGQCDEGERRVK